MAKKVQEPRILSVDLGYSAVKLAYKNKEGILVFDKLIKILKIHSSPLPYLNNLLF